MFEKQERWLESGEPGRQSEVGEMDWVTAGGSRASRNGKRFQDPVLGSKDKPGG